MNPMTDVLIVGGGIVGLSAAIAMQQRGFSVMLLDAGLLTMDKSSQNSRVYALNQASQNLLQKLGVWNLMDKDRLSPYHHMHVWDAVNNSHIDFDTRMIGALQLGFIIEESVIKSALLQKAAALNIKLISACKVSGVEHGIDKISVTDGMNAWSARLLIVADGAQSPLRQLLKVPMTTWSYQQLAIVATVKTEKPHNRTAYQVFNQDGPLAFLPMADLHECSIVWSTSPERAKHLMALSDDAFQAELSETFTSKLGCTTLLSMRTQFPLHMRHTKQYSGQRWLLMGDAAHTIHPLAGLGLNIGLVDLSIWLDFLSDDPRCIGASRNLNRYQRQRKHALWQTIAFMQGLHVLFSSSLAPVSALRGFGLKVCNQLLPLKRLLIEHAAGARAAVLNGD